jgi:hypothetical protein
MDWFIHQQLILLILESLYRGDYYTQFMYIITKHMFKLVHPRIQHKEQELKEKLAKFLHKKNMKPITALEDHISDYIGHIRSQYWNYIMTCRLVQCLESF